MCVLKSKSRTGLDNLTIEESMVAEIRLSPPFPKNPKLWLLYFFGRDGRIVRTWYYDSQAKRKKDLDLVLAQCSHLNVA
ncbi:hypothetical protein [Persicitalea jodogahamensis]|uniref:Uncharacterized protein n=1 Tax=Persicitalea jodogahamensis TaxID=402147 RepID=A0A8J3GAT5_9BACT|nr:hypothetical protein [Persicitalea jodogahamensis]GHB72055.1 hypothetical protein GCM10007390_27610 [Persicitalea jodogahamensis]